MTSEEFKKVAIAAVNAAFEVETERKKITVDIMTNNSIIMFLFHNKDIVKKEIIFKNNDSDFFNAMHRVNMFMHIAKAYPKDLDTSGD